MSFKKEQILKVNQNGVDYEVYPETKLHLVKDNNGVSLDKLMNIMTTQVEASSISTDSLAGELQNIEILGNTIQDPNNLTDIKSVGDKIEGQELYKIPIVCCGTNLNPYSEDGGIDNNGNDVPYSSSIRSGYIKVNKGVSYNWGFYNGTTLSPNEAHVFLYNKDKSFNKKVASVNGGTYTPDFDGYMRIYRTKNNLIDIMICANEIPTKFETYQEYKLNILSPVALEKIGDVADRIICKDGVWGVEKNIINILLNDINMWKTSTDSALGFKRYYYNKEISSNSKGLVLSDRFKGVENSYSQGDDNTISYNVNNKFLFISSKLQTLDEFKNFVGNLTVKLSTTTPQFISLPNEQQIKLQAFANKTNISFLTGIEGTIKAEIPKSLGASVNSNTQAIRDLNEDIEDIKRIKESTTVNIATDKGNVNCKDTVKGRINDVKLEGRTLVNVTSGDFPRQGSCEFESIIATATQREMKVTKAGSCVITRKGIFKRNTDYTIIAKVKFISDINELSFSFHDTVSNSYTIGIKAVNKLNNTDYAEYVIKLNTGDYDVDSLVIGYHGSLPVNSILGVKDVLALENDYTKNKVNHFEGIKSVGDDLETIEVISNNSNLFDESLLEPRLENDGYFHFRTKGNTRCSLFFGFVNPSKQQITTFSPNNYVNLTNVDLTGCYILIGINGDHADDKLLFPIKKSDNFNSKLFMGCDYELIDYNHIRVRNVFIQKECDNPKYVKHKQDKKKALYYDPNTQTWNKIILREWDSIEKHSNDKYYYHKRSIEETFKGEGENWCVHTDAPNQTNTIAFWLSRGFSYGNDSISSIICDKFNVAIPSSFDTKDEEAISSGSNIAFSYMIKIKRSKLSSLNKEGFKEWLKNNNITIVRKLMKEEVYECIPLELDTFDNETNFNISSIIPPKNFSFSLSTYIGNIIKDVQDDVKGLKTWKDKLENATINTVITNKNYAIAKETTNGYFNNIKLEGKTLVNLYYYTQANKDTNKIFYKGDTAKNKVFAGISVTLFNPTGKRIIVDIYSTSTDVWKRSVALANNELTKFVALASDEYIGYIYGQVADGWVSSDVELKKLKSCCLVLGGDHTGESVSYFEGIKSVGDDLNGINISSIKADGNLCDINTDIINAFSYGEFKNDTTARSALVRCKPNTKYYLKSIGNNDRGVVSTYTNKPKHLDVANKTLDGSKDMTITTGPNDYYLMYYITSDINKYKPENVYIGEKPFENNFDCKKDGKVIMYYDTEAQLWNNVILRDLDSINKHNNDKYYYHKRSIVKTLNGSEGTFIQYNSVAGSGVTNFAFNGLDLLAPDHGKIICDKLPVRQHIDDKDKIGVYIAGGNSKFEIGIRTSELSSQDEAGIKKWLQANPITIIFQAKQEQVYECTPIDLITYEDETVFNIESGSIIPTTILRIQNYIGKVIQTLQNKVSYLENKLYNSNLAGLTMALNNINTQNKLDQIIKSLNQK